MFSYSFLSRHGLNSREAKGRGPGQVKQKRIALRAVPVLLALLTAAPTNNVSQLVDAETASASRVTKVLVFVEENHSYSEMKAQMPYTFRLAQKYGYASNYRATRHPSLPNYLAMAGGSTFGVTDDLAPAQHRINAPSVFGTAIAAGRTAKVYAESMISNCAPTNVGPYAVRHNAWAYFVPSSEHQKCLVDDVPETALGLDISKGSLPNVGMVIPNICNDAHNCSLATADAWFKSRMALVLAGPDFTAGHLAVILTADEDDHTQSNTVLTVVVHPSLAGVGMVVRTPLNQYSLTRFLQDVSHSAPYLAHAATAPDLAKAFGLKAG